MLDFIAYNRVNTFVSKLVAVSNTVTDSSYIDTSPNGVFTAPSGTILQKRGNIISYKYPGENSFTTLNNASNSIGILFEKYSVILNRGVNRNVTWVKTSSDSETTWSNRGNGTNVAQICEIVPSTPCSSPVVTYIIVPPTPTPTSTNPPTNSCECGSMTVTHIYIDSTGQCEPAALASGRLGELRICENYIYVYDGTRWKRAELTTY